MNEERYSYMRDLVLCAACIACCCALSVSLLLSWCAFLSGGTMRRSLAIVEAIRRRLPRCRGNFGPRGSVADIIAGALCCERLSWMGKDRGMPFSTAPR